MQKCLTFSPKEFTSFKWPKTYLGLYVGPYIESASGFLILFAGELINTSPILYLIDEMLTLNGLYFVLSGPLNGPSLLDSFLCYLLKLILFFMRELEPNKNFFEFIYLFLEH